jgi:copper chaperone NosL
MTAIPTMKSTCKLFWALGLALLAGLLLSACSSSPNLDEPPEIVYGEDTCDRCKMIISEPRFAAAYVTPAGDPYRFDDLGEMVLYYQETSPEVAVYWVHDYETEEWLKADDAVFVSAAEPTPMGFGVVAFAARDAAETWAAEHDGELLTFAELLARPADMPMGGMS